MEINLTSVTKAWEDPAFAQQAAQLLQKAQLSIDGHELEAIELECGTKKKPKGKCMPVCACGAGYWAAN